MRKSATIQDVAKLAGVAPITVSRVVNNSGYVTRNVRDRVETAVAELGYVPNSLAQSLRSKCTHTLALILSDITNPFFTTVARGVEDAASDAGFMVIVCNTDESEEEELRYLKMLLQKRVDGVLLVPAGNAVESLTLLTRHGTSSVILDRRIANNLTDVVRCDSGDGARQLGYLLASHGHKRMAILAGPEGVSTFDDRVAEFINAVVEHNAAGVVEVFRGSLTPENGSSMVRRAVRSPNRPTAVFAANNFLAIGALHGLQEEGLGVPEDISLVGFDDLPSSMVTMPFLTVASQPAYEMGMRAVSLLLQRLKDPDYEAFKEVILPTELTVRRSHGNPSRRATLATSVSPEVMK